MADENNGSRSDVLRDTNDTQHVPAKNLLPTQTRGKPTITNDLKMSYGPLESSKWQGQTKLTDSCSPVLLYTSSERLHAGYYEGKAIYHDID